MGIAIRNIPSAVCFAGAAYLMSKGLDGWGWLLGVGVVCMSSEG